MYLKSLYPPVPPTPDANIHELLFNSPAQLELPDYTLYVDALSGRKRTRSEFNERVRNGATALGAPIAAGGLGLSGETGDVVGICSTNCMEYITVVQSLLAITTPFALISAFSTPFELIHALRLSKATCLFVQPSLLAKAARAAKELGLREDRIFILEGSAIGKKSFADLIDEAKRKGIPRIPVRPARRDTLAYLVFSSGTSGLPKAVMISHGNMWFTMQQYDVAALEDSKVNQGEVLQEPVKYLAVLPFHHTFGFQMFCVRMLVGYQTVVIVPRWDVSLVLKTIPKFGIHVLLLVPSILHQLVNSTLLHKADLSSVVAVSSGAAYLPPEIADKLKTFIKELPNVAEGYGLSECTLSACRKPTPGILGGLQPIRGSTGILIPGMEAKILRDDGSHCAVNEPGELWLTGGNIAMGYFGNEKATKETFIDGWLRTGDKFKTDGKGVLYFVDRAKDTLKVSGAQVSPTEIEDVLRAHPGQLITDVSVAGVLGGRTSDEKIPRAWILLSEEGKKRGEVAVIQELDAWIKENLSSYKWLRGGMEVIDEIPKSPTGKVLRRVLQDRYEEQRKAKAKL